MGKWVVGILAALFVLAGVGVLLAPEEGLANFAMGWLAPKAESAQARQYVEDIRNGKYAAIEAAFDRQFVTPEMPAQLAKVTALFPKEKPARIYLVGTNTATMDKQTTYRLTYQYSFAHDWLLAEVIMKRTDGKLVLYGVHVRPMTDSVQRANALTLRGKSLIHYAFAIGALLVFAFTAITAYVCATTPIPRRRWLWILFVMVGFGIVGFNWTTGEIGVGFLTVQLFSFGFIKPLFAPMVLKLSFPLGAIVFWSRRHVWLDEAATPSKDIRVDSVSS